MRRTSSVSRATAALAVCACAVGTSHAVRAHGLGLSATDGSGATAFGSASIDASSEVEPRTGKLNVEAENNHALADSPRWIASTEISGGSYRWSLSRGPFDIGLHMPAAASSHRGAEFRFEPAIGQANFVLPSFSVGLKQASSNPQSASSLLARAGGAGTESGVSRLGVEWKPAQSQVNFLREGLGFRLDGSDRMTVRLRKGVLGVYMHRKF